MSDIPEFRAEALTKHPDETLNWVLDFTDQIDDETLSTVSNVDVDRSTSPALTVSSETIVGASTNYLIDGTQFTVEASKGVSYQITGGRADTDYKVKFTVTDSDSQTRVGVQPVKVRD